MRKHGPHHDMKIMIYILLYIVIEYEDGGIRLDSIKDYTLNRCLVLH